MITAQMLITLFRQAPEEQWGRIRGRAGELFPVPAGVRAVTEYKETAGSCDPAG